MSLSNYEKQEKLGEGTYGVVFKALDKKNDDIVALKMIHLEHEDEGIPPTSLREISLLKELDHPNIVHLREVINHKQSLTLVFEFLDKDLKNFLETQRSPLNPMLIKSYAYQILSGICFCHLKGIIHRDMKPQNLLLNRAGLMKICDFGLARTFTIPMRNYTQEVVTLWYRAPELLLGFEQYGLGVDIWSIGCIIAEMFNKSALFPGDSEVDQLFSVFKVLGTPNEQDWPGISKASSYSPEFPVWGKKSLGDYINTDDKLALDLISQMLILDPSRRITAKAALDHPYFSDLSPCIKETCRPIEISSVNTDKLTAA